MAIKIKTVERSQAGIADGGAKKFYASAVHNGEISGEDLIKALQNVSSTLTGASITAMLYAMEKVVSDGLKEGKIVRLGDLGSFRITLNSEGKATSKEVTKKTIKKVGVIFSPSQRIQKTLRNAEFIKE